MSKKPTIEELEKIMDDPTDHPIIIQPDGSLKVDRRRKGKGFIDNFHKEIGKLSDSY